MIVIDCLQVAVYATEAWTWFRTVMLMLACLGKGDRAWQNQYQILSFVTVLTGGGLQSGETRLRRGSWGRML